LPEFVKAKFEAFPAPWLPRQQSRSW